MDASQRKILNTLYISGMAVLAFTLFDVIKFLLFWILDPTNFSYIQFLWQDGSMESIILLEILFGSIALEIIFGLIVGLGAINEGKGEKRSILYVIIAMIMMALSLAESGIMLFICFVTELSIFDFFESLASALLTLTISIALLDIIISYFKKRKLQKESD